MYLWMYKCKYVSMDVCICRYVRPLLSHMFQLTYIHTYIHTYILQMTQRDVLRGYALSMDGTKKEVVAHDQMMTFYQFVEMLVRVADQVGR